MENLNAWTVSCVCVFSIKVQYIHFSCLKGLYHCGTFLNFTCKTCTCLMHYCVYARKIFDLLRKCLQMGPKNYTTNLSGNLFLLKICLDLWYVLFLVQVTWFMLNCGLFSACARDEKIFCKILLDV